MRKALVKRTDASVSEKAQYALTFGVISVLLYFVGFPLFIIAILGAAAFLAIKYFTPSMHGETRKIFEFYLIANDILSDDDRRWYGFEMKEAIALGEKLISGMTMSPPLLRFALGALYSRSGDHSSAVKHLHYVFDDESATEAALVFPTQELRDYVRLLRKIEREPAESPLTSAAILSLERMRTNHGSAILSDSLTQASGLLSTELIQRDAHSICDFSLASNNQLQETNENVDLTNSSTRKKNDLSSEKPNFALERKPITEVLHDIYDKKVH